MISTKRTRLKAVCKNWRDKTRRRGRLGFFQFWKKVGGKRWKTERTNFLVWLVWFVPHEPDSKSDSYCPKLFKRLIPPHSVLTVHPLSHRPFFLHSFLRGEGCSIDKCKTHHQLVSSPPQTALCFEYRSSPPPTAPPPPKPSGGISC